MGKEGWSEAAGREREGGKERWRGRWKDGGRVKGKMRGWRKVGWRERGSQQKWRRKREGYNVVNTIYKRNIHTCIYM